MDSGGVYKYVTSPSPARVLLTTLDGIVGALAVDRSNANVLYAGTGAGSVYKSTNGGTTWAHTSLGGGSVNSITANSGSVLAATTGGALPATTPPAPATLTPAASSGSSQILTATFNAPGGYQTINVVNVLINTALDAHQAC